MSDHRRREKIAGAAAPRCWDDEPGCNCGGYQPSDLRKIAADELRAAADWIWDDAPARASASAELHDRADHLDQP